MKSKSAELNVHEAVVSTEDLTDAQRKVLAIIIFEVNTWRDRLNQLWLKKRRNLSEEDRRAFSSAGILQVFVVGSEHHMTRERALRDPRPFDIVVRSSSSRLLGPLTAGVRADVEAVRTGDPSKFSRPTRLVDAPAGHDKYLPHGVLHELARRVMTPGQKNWARRNQDKAPPAQVYPGLLAPGTYAVVGVDSMTAGRLALRLEEALCLEPKTKGGGKKKSGCQDREAFRDSKARYQDNVASSLASSAR